MPRITVNCNHGKSVCPLPVPFFSCLLNTAPSYRPMACMRLFISLLLFICCASSSFASATVTFGTASSKSTLSLDGGGSWSMGQQKLHANVSLLLSLQGQPVQIQSWNISFQGIGLVQMGMLKMAGQLRSMAYPMGISLFQYDEPASNILAIGKQVDFHGLAYGYAFPVASISFAVGTLPQVGIDNMLVFAGIGHVTQDMAISLGYLRVDGPVSLETPDEGADGKVLFPRHGRAVAIDVTTTPIELGSLVLTSKMRLHMGWDIRSGASGIVLASVQLLRDCVSMGIGVVHGESSLQLLNEVGSDDRPVRKLAVKIEGAGSFSSSWSYSDTLYAPAERAGERQKRVVSLRGTIGYDIGFYAISLDASHASTWPRTGGRTARTLFKVDARAILFSVATQLVGNVTLSRMASSLVSDVMQSAGISVSAGAAQVLVGTSGTSCTLESSHDVLGGKVKWAVSSSRVWKVSCQLVF